MDLERDVHNIKQEKCYWEGRYGTLGALLDKQNEEIAGWKGKIEMI